MDCFWEELDRLWFDVLRIWNLLKCQSFNYFSKIFMYVLFVKGEIVKNDEPNIRKDDAYAVLTVNGS